ncbi:MAG: hypothetical protein QM652_04360 [Legionella sp.]
MFSKKDAEDAVLKKLRRQLGLFGNLQTDNSQAANPEGTNNLKY